MGTGTITFPSGRKQWYMKHSMREDGNFVICQHTWAGIDENNKRYIEVEYSVYYHNQGKCGLGEHRQLSSAKMAALQDIVANS